MSIISNKAEHVYKGGALLQEAYIAGALRQPTDEEIEAGAKAFYEALQPDYYPQWDSNCALKADYIDALRLAIKAMQGKATEDEPPPDH